MQYWKKLETGDAIDIIAPGWAISSELLSKVKNYVEAAGFKAHIPKDLIGQHQFHSSADEVRLRHLKNALNNANSKAIWCLRGGYGSQRLVPEVLKMKKPRQPKLLIGISDITALHLVLNQNWQWPSLHASLLDRLGDARLPENCVQELFSLLRGEQVNVEFNGLKPLNQKAKLAQKKKAKMIGGNLSVLQTTLGTKLSVNTEGRFLFLEDIGERGYRVDKMLVHLYQAGALKGCLGLFFGQFTGGNEPAPSQENFVAAALQRFADENPKIPMWSGLPSGHDLELHALPLGCPSTLVVKNALVSLSVESGCR